MGADRRGRAGKFAQADGGRCSSTRWATCPWACRRSAARAGGEGSRAAGSNRAAKVDVRVVAASSVDPAPDGEHGPVPLRPLLPALGAAHRAAALRERASDLEALCEHILETSRASGRPQRELARRRSRCSAPIPGRKHPRAAQRARAGDDALRRVAAVGRGVQPGAAAARRPGARRRAPTLRLADIVADAERNAIRSALAAADGRRSLPRSCSASRAPRSTRSSPPWRRATTARGTEPGGRSPGHARAGRTPPGAISSSPVPAAAAPCAGLLVRGELPDDGVVLGRRGIGRVRVRLADRLVLGDVGLMQSW